MPMKLHGLARVKNEADIIEEFVRHNLRYLDGLTVVDNASFDGTLEMLEALRSEGLPLTIRHDPVLPKRQAEAYTRFARESLVECDWDFLFLLDADEFIKSDGREVLENSLRALPVGTNGRLPWVTYVPAPDDDANEPRHLNRMRKRLPEEPTQYYKIVLSRAYAVASDFRITEGNHAARGAHGEAPTATLDGATLAHLPVRSVAQVQGKALLGWGAYLAMGYDEAAGLGFHQRRLFQRLERSHIETADDLYEIALRYTAADGASHEVAVAIVDDPIGSTLELRYGAEATLAPMQIATRYVRQLAVALARAEASAASVPSLPIGR